MLAKRHHPFAAHDLAHYAQTAIADLMHERRLFAASALLSRFGSAAAHDLESAALALILVALAQGQLYQHLDAGYPLVFVQHWRAE